MDSISLLHEVSTPDHLTDLEREAMLSSATVGVVFTRNEHILHANPFFERMFEYNSGELNGKHVSIVFPTSEDFDAVNEYSTPLFNNRSPVQMERITLRKHGSQFWCRMLGQVINSTDTKLKGIIWIVEDISERKAFEQQLKDAAERAEAANQAKSMFLANASHELRTPLNGLIGLANLAQQPDINSKLRDQYLCQIGEIAKNLNSIVTNILDLSKIEYNVLELEQAPFVLGQVIQNMHATFATVASTKGLSFNIEIDDNVDDVVVGDSTRLKQILSNYINNAIKFTVEGGLRLSIVKDGDFTRFSVYDTGIGIPTETCENLFRPFTQADESITRKFGGTGLGLSICKQFAELMGGSVGVRSMTGQGSCFWLEIPLPRANDKLTINDTRDINLSVLKDKTVLVIEDNMVNMLITTAILEQQKIKIISADNGSEALEKLKTDVHIDCILSDLHMPGLSGYETARLTRQLNHRKTVPIIALTAAAFLEEKQQALASGMTSFLTKPIDSPALYQELAIQISAHPQSQK